MADGDELGRPVRLGGGGYQSLERRDPAKNRGRLWSLVRLARIDWGARRKCLARDTGDTCPPDQLPCDAAIALRRLYRQRSCAIRWRRTESPGAGRRLALDPSRRPAGPQPSEAGEACDRSTSPGGGCSGPWVRIDEGRSVGGWPAIADTSYNVP